MACFSQLKPNLLLHQGYLKVGPVSLRKEKTPDVPAAHDESEESDCFFSDEELDARWAAAPDCVFAAVFGSDKDA